MAITSLSWEALWTLGKHCADRLRPQCHPDVQRLLISPLAIREGLALLCASLHLGLDPVFDEKNSAAAQVDKGLLHVPIDFWDDESMKGTPAVAGLRLLPHRESMHACLDRLESRNFIFCTSGSTGQAQSFSKSARGLLLEIEQLATLYKLDKDSTIVSLVRPFHIYGFLHSFLLPLFTLNRVIYWSTQEALPTEANAFPQTVDLLVLVPAQWRLVTHLWESASLRQLVSSGAPFGSARAAELRAFEGRYHRFFEILGSTETGGIGHKQINSGSPVFTLFQGVRIEAALEGTRVYSPFLVPDQAVVSADRLESLSETTFQHLGRRDRVFKYGGLRCSLEEVEGSLKDVMDGALIVSYFKEDSNIAQGGILYAWAESASLSNADIPRLRQAYQQKTKAPFPQKMHFLAELPRDPQGKIMLSGLLLTRPSHPEA